MFLTLHFCLEHCLPLIKIPSSEAAGGAQPWALTEAWGCDLPSLPCGLRRAAPTMVTGWPGTHVPEPARTPRMCLGAPLSLQRLRLPVCTLLT